MVWSFPVDAWNRLKLALECEWSLDRWEIWHDFEKLLVVRSEHRVFIFNSYNNDKVNNLIKEFKDSITNFKATQPGDRYFFAGYSRSEGKFIFDNMVA